MSQHNRVVWAEGLFLRPQHFQQAERYFERLMSQRLESLAPYAAGFTKLQIDQELLKIGKVGLVAAEGVFPDGTPFSIPFEADIPEAFDVPGDVKDRLVLVTLPLRRAGMAELAFERSGDSSLVRYIAADHEIRDAVLEMDSSAQLKIGRLNVRLQLDGETSAAHTALGVGRVVEKRADGRVVLDDGYVAPCLDCRVSGRLQDYVKELHGLVRHRIQALADRVSSPGTKGVADVSDFLLLQLCNRYEPLLAHFLTRASLHPELFYRTRLELAGEIAHLPPGRPPEHVHPGDRGNPARPHRGDRAERGRDRGDGPRPGRVCRDGSGRRAPAQRRLRAGRGRERARRVAAPAFPDPGEDRPAGKDPRPGGLAPARHPDHAAASGAAADSLSRRIQLLRARPQERLLEGA